MSLAGVEAAAHRIVDRVIAQNEIWGDYTLDLMLESLLEWFDASTDCRALQQVEKVVAARGLTPESPWPWRKQPFCHLNFALGRHLNSAWDRVFVEESQRLVAEAPRDPDGLFLHESPAHGAGLLIDMLGDVVARLARAGSLSGDTSLIDEVADQLVRHEAILRSETHGCWSQGRGWIRNDPAALSPGAWSRGQGWLLRGMVRALEHVPPDHAAFESVRTCFERLCGAVLQRLRANIDHFVPEAYALLPQLLHLQATESQPDSSGSAMLLEAVLRGLRHGLLPEGLGRDFDDALRHLEQGLVDCVDAEGTVLQSCPGPGTLTSLEPYLNAPRPPAEPHGPPALLTALAEAIRPARAR